MGDHERIWLEPACAEDERCWRSDPLDDCAEEGCGLPATEYVRADILAARDARIAALEAEREKLREALAEAADELDAYYTAEYPTDHPYHVRKLETAKSANPARAALQESPPMTDRFISPEQPPEGLDRELLVILMEECAEITQRASKALRFGLHEVQPGQPLSARPPSGEPAHE